MSNRIHIFDFLEAKRKPAIPPICVVFGDDLFLRRLARRRIRDELLHGDEESLFASIDGEQTQWRDVSDELSTRSLFSAGGCRLVIVEQAAAFVSKYRVQLEKYVERPKTTSVLVLDVDSWPANTRLYQAIDKVGLAIECRPPEKLLGKQKILDDARLCRWLSDWSQARYDAKLALPAARLLLEINGPEFGILDQNLAKLALFVEPKDKITPELVRDVVGGWRAKTAWELADAAADGEAADALRQLDHLLGAGEYPLAVLAQISWSLRRFAAATRIFEDAEQRNEPIEVRQALEQAGFRNWPPKAMDNAQRQLRQLGRQRAGALYGWLLEADLALKGSHSSPHRGRFVLEQLILRLAKRPAR